MREKVVAVIDGNDILRERSCSVSQVVEQAIVRARETGARVKFEFNGVTVTVAADSDAGRINDTFALARKARLREVGPYPPDVEKFDDAKAAPYVLHDHGRRDAHINVTAYQLTELGWGRTRSVDKPNSFVPWMGVPGAWYVKLRESGVTFLLREVWGDTFQACDCSA